MCVCVCVCVCVFLLFIFLIWLHAADNVYTEVKVKWKNFSKFDVCFVLFVFPEAQSNLFYFILSVYFSLFWWSATTSTASWPSRLGHRHCESLMKAITYNCNRQLSVCVFYHLLVQLFAYFFAFFPHVFLPPHLFLWKISHSNSSSKRRAQAAPCTKRPKRSYTASSVTRPNSTSRKTSGAIGCVMKQKRKTLCLSLKNCTTN